MSRAFEQSFDASRVPVEVRRLVRTPARGAVAFDADGVLWHGDVSEDFTRWMIGHGRFDADLWRDYEATNARDPAAACLQILRFYESAAPAAIGEDVGRFWAAGPPRRWITRAVHTLLWLAAQGFAVYVVSATPAPVLAPLREGLPLAGLLALELEVDGDGRFTGRAAGVPTIGEGKAERLRAAARAPVRLAVGNSILDLAMLRASERLAWSINPDAALRAEAARAGWLISEEPE